MTDLIGELRNRALLKELDPIRRPGAGRPTRPIDFDGEPWCVLGVNIDIDRVEFVGTTMGGRELWSETYQVSLIGSGAEQGYAAVADLLASQLLRVPEDSRLVAIHVGVPAYVARDGQTVTWSPTLDWHDFALHTAIGKTLADAGLDGVHVGVSNGCHLAALYAARVDLGLSSDGIVAYLGGRRALGTGLVIEGEIYRGAFGGAGDFIHQTVSVSGPVPKCECGRTGCLYAFVDPVGLLAAGGTSPADAAQSVLDAPEAAVVQIAAAAADGHADTLAALSRAGSALGDAIDLMVGVVNPNAVVLGGYLAELSPYLLPTIHERLVGRLALEIFSATKVDALGNSADRTVGGAVLAARDACFYDPLALTRPLSAAVEVSRSY